MILRFDGLRASPITLWITGNKLIQRQLALGVTHVYLENATSSALLCVPSCLQELRHLRFIAVDRTEFRVLFPSSATSTLRSLPPCLNKLVLDMEHANEIVFPFLAKEYQSAKEALHPELNSRPDDMWSLKAAYPQLESLFLPKTQWTLEMVSELPNSLTKLSGFEQNDPTLFVTLIKALPPRLDQLSVTKLPIHFVDFMSLLSDRHLLTLDFGTSLSKPEQIALLPRTLTEISTLPGLPVQFRPIVDSHLTQAAVAALPPALTSLQHLSHSPEVLYFDHLKELVEIGHESSDGPALSVASIKRLPPKLHTLNLTGDLDGITKADWPPLLTYLEWSPKSPNFSLDALPSRLTSLLIQNFEFTISLKMVASLPRSLTWLGFTCTHPFECEANVDFPPSLKFLNMDCRYYCDWVVVEPFKMMIRTDEEGDKEVDFDITEVGHLDQLDRRPNVTMGFPFHSLPHELEELSLACCVPASQLVHLPPRLKAFELFEIFEDADFDANDPLLLTKMSELAAIGLREEGIVTPASHIALPASPASLLPRTLSSIALGSSRFLQDCDWTRFPPKTTSIQRLESKLPLSATLFKTAPFSHLRTLEVSLWGLTDEMVPLMPQTLTAINWSFVSDPPLTEACLLHWPPGIAYQLPDHLNAAYRILEEKRNKAIDSSSIPDLVQLFPNCYLAKLYQQ